MAQGFEFIAEKFQSRGPGAGERPDIEDAAAQGDFAFLRDLGLRLVTLLFEPFDQVERIDLIAALEPRACGCSRSSGAKVFCISAVTLVTMMAE